MEQRGAAVRAGVGCMGVAAVLTVTLVCRASFDGGDCHLQRFDGGGGRFSSSDDDHLASLRVLRASDGRLD